MVLLSNIGCNVTVTGNLLTSLKKRSNSDCFLIKTKLIGSEKINETFSVISDKSLNVTLNRGSYVRFSGRLKLNQKNPSLYPSAGSIYVNSSNTIELLSSKKPQQIFQIIQEKLYSSLSKGLANQQNIQHLLFSMILGDKNRVTDKTIDIFKRTGTIHILAISGLHVGLILLIIRGFLLIAGATNRFATSGAILFLVIYNIILGFRPSVARASIMLAALMAGIAINRKTDPLNSLGLACVSILLFFPQQAFMPGFVLSFAAVISIISFGKVFLKKDLCIYNKIHLFIIHKLFYWIKSLSFASASAWVGLAPLIALYFGTVSVIALPANILAIPLLSLSIGFAVLSTITGFITPYAPYIINKFFIGPVIGLALWILEMFSSIPWAQARIPAPSLLWIGAYYLSIGLLLSAFVKKKDKNADI